MVNKTILHGDNTVVSRNHLNQLLKEAKDKNLEVIKLDGNTASLTDIKVSLETTSLFGQEKIVIIERLFSRQLSKEKKEILSYLIDEIDNLPSIIFWEGKEVTPANLKKFNNSLNSKKFKIPSLVFKFLDSFQPNNQKNLLAMLAGLKKGDTEFVFYMLARRLNQLLILKDLGPKGLKIAPWQQYRLSGQAKNFTVKQLVSLYKKLLLIDTKIKTGETLIDLNYHLDLLLVNL